MSTCNYCEIEFDDDGTCEGCCCVPCAEAYEDEQVVKRLRARVAELEAVCSQQQSELAESRTADKAERRDDRWRADNFEMMLRRLLRNRDNDVIASQAAGLLERHGKPSSILR